MRGFTAPTNDAYAFTQTYVSLGSPDGADFAFARTADDGTFTFTTCPVAIGELPCSTNGPT